MSGRLYRVVKRFPWIEGGRPAPGGEWEGGESVAYEPGDTVHLEDQDLDSMYLYVEALDEAGRAVLEEARAKAEAPAKVVFLSSLSAEQRNTFGWAVLVPSKIKRGEGLKETLIWAIRNGLALPDDLKERALIADALEGKLDPERGRGRPRKKQLWDIARAATERGIVKVYEEWLAAFQRDREQAWLRYEALRLREEHPEADVWRRRYGLYMEEARQSFKAALTALGALSCPPAGRGAETPRELALKATAQERGAVWESETGQTLTPSVVARIATRAKKSK